MMTVMTTMMTKSSMKLSGGSQDDDSDDDDEDEISDDIHASDIVLNIFGSVTEVDSIKNQLAEPLQSLRILPLTTWIFWHLMISTLLLLVMI